MNEGKKVKLKVLELELELPSKHFLPSFPDLTERTGWVRVEINIRPVDTSRAVKLEGEKKWDFFPSPLLIKPQ